jgi:hypothetical protein
VDLDSQPGNAIVFLGLKRPPRECITPVPGYSKLGLIARASESRPLPQPG